ncbi:hypothetical protein GALMADRAFT_386996 [Galerina marginata CBS 339.88]|uniref:Uncharacterized protein n=1 Tax=Galerina marginata (strain CBS 339.88) TaxID=685588 RepID=A0A067U307_GALM3|nr:hypothetical protein GALMADRAFT_386996 [Galerina marginata CBS 339.88]
MEGLINILYHYNWPHFQRFGGFRHFWALRVFKWIHDQLNTLELPILFLPDELRTTISQKMLDIMVQIYHGPIASLLSETPFSDNLCVLHKTYTRSVNLVLGSSPNEVEITEGDSDLSFADINIIRNTINDYFSTISTITPILKHAKYCQVISASHWSTLAAEFYLHMTAKNQYHRLHPEFKSYSRLLDATFTASGFDFWLLHVNPTQKMLLALRAIRCLCYKVPEKWQAPAGFCSLVMGLLQKFQLEETECSKFYSWLEDLKQQEQPRLMDEQQIDEFDVEPQTSHL